LGAISFDAAATLRVILGAFIGASGDADRDGDVDIDDLNNVRNHFGALGPDDGSLPGDAYPFDGQVDIDDLNAVRNNFGGGSAAVPEPGAMAIALGLLIAAGGLGRRNLFAAQVANESAGSSARQA